MKRIGILLIYLAIFCAVIGYILISKKGSSSKDPMEKARAAKKAKSEAKKKQENGSSEK